MVNSGFILHYIGNIGQFDVYKVFDNIISLYWFVCKSICKTVWVSVCRPCVNKWYLWVKNKLKKRYKKNSRMDKRTKTAIEQIISDHKKKVRRRNRKHNVAFIPKHTYWGYKSEELFTKRSQTSILNSSRKIQFSAILFLTDIHFELKSSFAPKNLPYHRKSS